MCRIDASYDNLFLDEKTDPTERFIQALDERGIDGHFRDLLVKHFSENRNRVFASNLEEALSSVKRETSDRENCAAILSSSRLAFKLAMQLIERHPTLSEGTGVVAQGSDEFMFAREVAQTYFSESPYALYDALRTLGSTTSSILPYDQFFTALYGEESCFSHSLFDDPAINAEDESTRNNMLWGFFNTISQHPDGNENDLAGMCEIQTKNLISVASLELHAGPPTIGSHKFLQGIRFLKAWIASDAAAGRLSSAYEGVFDKLDFEWSSFYPKMRSISSSNSALREVSDAATTWLDKTKIRLKETFCLHIDLTSADDHQIEQWASQLNDCFKSLSIRYPDILTQSREEQDATENEHLHLICSQLTSHQIETWIKWSIKKDIESALRQSDSPLLNREFCGDESRKWWASEYPTTWKSKLEEELNCLDIKDKLTVLSGTLRRLPNEAAALEYRAWWNDLFKTLIQDPEFPVALTPQWTSAAVDRLDNELVVPYIDKSLGLLRGELSNGAQPYHHKQLEELLGKLRFFNPSKALRHSLMLMRSSTLPFSDESVARFNPVNSDKAIGWYWPLKDVARNRFAKNINSRPSVSQEEYEQAEWECYESFALEVAQFCLSRLRLRKGEKAKDGRYDASQVTEKSPIWRQGYLKALLELGLDPGGKAHKTAYFTKQFDPDESVREVAKECYRAVRREAKKNRSIRDLRRGLIAAEWWLLMSQRLELNLSVNHEEALKIRRNLLRNPS